jgi:hypothetical protein
MAELSNFNSNEYAWKDMKVVVGGRVVAGLRGLKFKTSRTTTPVYASGSKPHTITRGNKTHDGSMTMLQSEVEALLEAVQQKFGANADLTDGVLDVTAAFAVTVTSRIKTHSLISIHITEFEMGMLQDDPNMEIELPFIALDIKYNI